MTQPLDLDAPDTLVTKLAAAERDALLEAFVTSESGPNGYQVVLKVRDLETLFSLHNAILKARKLCAGEPYEHASNEITRLIAQLAAAEARADRNAAAVALEADARGEAEAENVRLREALVILNSFAQTLLDEHGRVPKQTTRVCVPHWQHVAHISRQALASEPGK